MKTTKQKTRKDNFEILYGLLACSEESFNRIADSLERIADSLEDAAGTLKQIDFDLVQ